jgi:ribose transport system substrate-binding protein
VHLDLAWWRKLYASVKPGDPKIHGKVAVIEGIAGTFFSVKRVQGFHNVVDKFPGVKIVADLPADWNRAKGTAAAENILSAHPDLDAIWAASNEMGLGAMNVVYANSKQNQIKVLTNDGTPESVQRIREGKLLAETWHGFPEWGWYGGAYAVMAALGETPPHIFNIDPRTEYAGNADQFYPHPHLGAIDFQAIAAHATK